MKLLFIGTGYVGLVSGVMLASCGMQVTCLDNDKNKIAQLKKSQPVIYEPGLNQYITKSIESGNLFFINDYAELSSNPDAVFITVGTPSLASGDANLEYVFNAATEAAKHTSDDTLIIIKSTVPPGTAEQIQNFLASQKYKHQVISNPEFLREGKAINDFMHPDRIVIGLKNDSAKLKMQQIYVKFNSLFFTDLTTAELIKYSSNAFLATKIAFINEMANICEKTGGNIDDLSRGMGLDKRIGADFLKVGPGFGGSCFPKDILALEYLAKKYQEPFHVLSAVIHANQQRRIHTVNKIEKHLGTLKDKKLAVLGLAFKADTDDIRSSPAIDIIELLIKRGSKIVAYDPEAIKNTKLLELNIDFGDTAKEILNDADAAIILTEWQEFKELDFLSYGSQMKNKIIFDYRNILNASYLRKGGFQVYQLGKQN